MAARENPSRPSGCLHSGAVSLADQPPRTLTHLAVSGLHSLAEAHPRRGGAPPMTTLESATADTSKLPDYLGQPVLRTTLSIRNAGDGLSEGLGIDPQLLQIGSIVHVVLECKVVGHDHDEMKGAPGNLVLDQVLKAGTGVIIDAEVVKEAVAQQAERIQRARDKAAGRERLPYDEELQKAHDLGEHAGGLAEGCASCGSEQTAAAEEGAAEPTPITGRRRGSKAEGAAEPTPITGRRRGSKAE